MKRQVFISGAESFRVEKKDGTLYYLLSQDNGMLEVDRSHFIKELDRFRELCENTLDSTLREEYSSIREYIKL